MFNCELFRLDTLFFVFSIAFQVAGAVILIIKYFGKTEERIKQEYYPGSNIAPRDENEYTKLEGKKCMECAQRIYDNRASFSFIALGYILSIFGDASGQCRVCVLMMTITCTIVIILLEKGISNLISYVFYRNGIECPYSEVSEWADTEATKEEIEELAKKEYSSLE